MRRFSLLSFLTLVLACGSRGDTASGGFSASLGVDTTKMTKAPSGLWYTDLAAGQGAEAEPGKTVRVHYTGWLPNGKKFDSSRDRGEPFAFTLGAGQVIDIPIAGESTEQPQWKTGPLAEQQHLV